MGNTENLEEINITVYLDGVEDPICETALDLIEDERQGIKGFKFKYKDNMNNGNSYFIAADSVVCIRKSYDDFNEFENTQESEAEDVFAGIFWGACLGIVFILIIILTLVLARLIVNA